MSAKSQDEGAARDDAADEGHDDPEDAVGGDEFDAAEVLQGALAEVGPAQQGGDDEGGEADGEQEGADATHGGEGVVGEHFAGFGVDAGVGHDGDGEGEAGEGADDDGVPEGAGGGDEACWTGFGVRTGAETMGEEPMPASLEKRPRLQPVCMASMRQEPMKPPPAACSVKAAVQMRRMAGQMYSAFAARSMPQPIM